MNDIHTKSQNKKNGSEKEKKNRIRERKKTGNRVER